ncbi:hypothetical protein NON27_31865, partial [Vibrio parahaemolyticus]|nr:hypothetical protein [Vibrio parahaemolyticus]
TYCAARTSLLVKLYVLPCTIGFVLKVLSGIRFSCGCCGAEHAARNATEAASNSFFILLLLVNI